MTALGMIAPNHGALWSTGQCAPDFGQQAGKAAAAAAAAAAAEEGEEGGKGATKAPPKAQLKALKGKQAVQGEYVRACVRALLVAGWVGVGLGRGLLLKHWWASHKWCCGCVACWGRMGACCKGPARCMLEKEEPRLLFNLAPLTLNPLRCCQRCAHVRARARLHPCPTTMPAQHPCCRVGGIPDRLCCVAQARGPFTSC